MVPVLGLHDLGLLGTGPGSDPSKKGKKIGTRPDLKALAMQSNGPQTKYASSDHGDHGDDSEGNGGGLEGFEL